MATRYTVLIAVPGVAWTASCSPITSWILACMAVRNRGRTLLPDGPSTRLTVDEEAPTWENWPSHGTGIVSYRIPPHTRILSLTRVPYQCSIPLRLEGGDASVDIFPGGMQALLLAHQIQSQTKNARRTVFDMPIPVRLTSKRCITSPPAMTAPFKIDGQRTL